MLKTCCIVQKGRQNVKIGDELIFFFWNLQKLWNDLYGEIAKNTVTL